MDSVARITEELTRLKVADEQRIADSIAAENEANLQNKAKYKIALADAKTALLLAKEKLSSIKEFQLGRLDWEKEKQIEDQYKVIQSCEMEVDRIQSKLLKYD